MQVLSCASAGVLVAVCGLLLRSQSLISGARSPNFEISDPGSESNGVSQELIPIIVILIGLISAPAFITIGIAIHANSKFKKAALAIEQKTNEAALSMRRASMNVLGQENNSQSQVYSGQIESKDIQSKQSLPAAEESSAATGPWRLPDPPFDEVGNDDLPYGAAEKPLYVQVSELKKQLEVSQLENALLHFKITNLRDISMQQPLSFSPAALPIPADSVGSAVQSRLADETSLNRNTGYPFNFKGSASTQRFQQPRALSSPILADPSDFLTDDESPSHSLSFRQDQLPEFTQQHDEVIVAELFSPHVRTLPQQSRRQFLADSVENLSHLSQHADSLLRDSPSINADASSARAVRQNLRISMPLSTRSSSKTGGSSDSIDSSSDRAAADSSIISSPPQPFSSRSSSQSSGFSLARRLDQI
jgi:hypothetical protein